MDINLIHEPATVSTKVQVTPMQAEATAAAAVEVAVMVTVTTATTLNLLATDYTEALQTAGDTVADFEKLL